MGIYKYIGRCSGVFLLMLLLVGCGTDSAKEVRTTEVSAQRIESIELADSMESESFKATATAIETKDVETEAVEMESTGESAEVESLTQDEDVAASGIRAVDETRVDRMILGNDFSEHYMCRADFIGLNRAELRLVRNSVYARKGAMFQSEDLKTYFESKPWYQGEVPAAEFPDEMLSDVELANIALIQELEAAEQNERDREVFQTLPDAPYLSYLDMYWETGLRADMKQAEDMGLYYIVPGGISHPLSFSEEQRLAMEDGQEIEIVVNEVSGETKLLRKAPKSEYYPTYFLYEKGSEPDAYDRGVYASLDSKNGVYTLWKDSADTLMKTVYEGDLYILKGAVTGAHTSMELAYENQTEILIPGQNAESWEGLIGGNHLCHDGRGYFSAVYALGD